jgi:hypothetical protein
MITVQLPRSTVPEQERLPYNQNELFRAKQELQWEQLQVQHQHERLARERCISAILAAHQKSRMPLDDLYPRPGDYESDAAPARQLLRLISETCRGSRVVSSGATLLVAYLRHALECARGLPARSHHLVSTIALACGLREHQTRSSTKGAKRSSATGARRSAAKRAKRSSKPSWMEPARTSSWMERARAGHWMERARVSHWASWRCFSQ